MSAIGSNMTQSYFRDKQNHCNSSVRTANKHVYEFALHFEFTSFNNCNIAPVIDKLTP